MDLCRVAAAVLVLDRDVYRIRSSTMRCVSGRCQIIDRWSEAGLLLGSMSA